MWSHFIKFWAHNAGWDQAIWNSEILVFVDKILELLINGFICFSDNCSGNPDKGNFNPVYSEGGTSEHLNFQYCSKNGGWSNINQLWHQV